MGWDVMPWISIFITPSSTPGIMYIVVVLPAKKGTFNYVHFRWKGHDKKLVVWFYYLLCAYPSHWLGGNKERNHKQQRPLASTAAPAGIAIVVVVSAWCSYRRYLSSAKVDGSHKLIRHITSYPAQGLSGVYGSCLWLFSTSRGINSPSIFQPSCVDNDTVSSSPPFSPAFPL